MKKLTLTDRLRGFKHAFKGLVVTWREEPNTLIHVLVAMVVVAAGFYFDLNRQEWILIVLCIGLVWSAEIFNTAIENLCDAVTLEQNERIGKAKDVSAAGVLLVSITSGIIGFMVFADKVWLWINAGGL